MEVLNNLVHCETVLTARCIMQVVDGRVRRDALKVRVKRHGRAVWEGKLLTVKQVKQEVEQVGKGGECGLMFDGYSEAEVGDTIEVVELVSRRPKLEGTATGAQKIVE